MPTPSPHALDDTILSRTSPHATCPPESERPRLEHIPSNIFARLGRLSDGHSSHVSGEARPQPMTPEIEDVSNTLGDANIGDVNMKDDDNSPKPIDSDDETHTQLEPMTPESMAQDSKDVDHRMDTTHMEHPIATSPRIVDDYSPSMDDEFSNVRLLPNSSSSFLRPGSKFKGTQESDRQVYTVEVELKHVDMAESYLCGYLRIQGLTEHHATLTTYFEGELIGNKYSFVTHHPAWGATEKTDFQHWAKFPAWRPLQKSARHNSFTIKNFATRENIFMRWKEHFLVPDHRVRAISGASFEGFYYICFNQIEGHVSGIYYHSKSEKFQKLELEHVPDKGCFGAMEFR
ncbi:MAG: hypothetical protein M1834_001976 [Cirrosporium novae-zelandiae]|nr:MAG: hypothetical protein M1834_001976 [Cirrosporium novae-zelandiae]